MKFRILSLMVLLCSYTLYSAVDVIIFSKDRPLQLCALLESLRANTTGYDQLLLIYCASSDDYGKAYDQCFDAFKDMHLTMFKQGSNPRADFKTLTMQALSLCRNKYMAFAVDDIIVTEKINFQECEKYLEQTNAYGFYLRLGSNITKSPMIGVHYSMPSNKGIDDKIVAWQFSDGHGEWNYPHSVDLVVYRTHDVKTLLSNLVFNTPNTLEGSAAMPTHVSKVQHNYGLCYNQSKIINIPFNVVQDDWYATYGVPYKKDHFLHLFNQGYRIDVSRYFGTVLNAPHGILPLHTSKDEL